MIEFIVHKMRSKDLELRRQTSSSSGDQQHHNSRDLDATTEQDEEWETRKVQYSVLRTLKKNDLYFFVVDWYIARIAG